MNNTRADDVSIQAILPESKVGASDAADGVSADTGATVAGASAAAGAVVAGGGS